jgi:hypothetical protein
MDEQDSRALQALHTWITRDEEGSAVLERLRRDPERTAQEIIELLGRRSDAPEEFRTTVRDSARVNQIVNIARLYVSQSAIRALIDGMQRLPFDAGTGIQNFFDEYLGTPEQPAPFGGREAGLAALNGWLEDAAAPPRLLLTAPAGRGKSALLARWTRELLSCPSLEVIFIPISLRFGTNRGTTVFSSLAARLASLHGAQEFPGVSTSTEMWKNIAASYLARPLPDGQRLVVILDGLDEAADWEARRDLFPTALPAGLRIVVSARELVNDQHGQRWLRRLGWHRQSRARVFTLGPLDHEGVASVLRSVSLPAELRAQEGSLADEVFRLSGGDPLLVQLYVEDVRGDEKAAPRLRPAELKTRRPGFGEYVEDWWADQQELWDENRQQPLQQAAVRTILNLLSVARGPLARADIVDHLAETSEGIDSLTLDQYLQLLNRFIIGNGESHGYVFSHSLMRDHFNARMTPAERGSWEARFRQWGEETIGALREGRLAPEKVAPYLVQYYAAHLELDDSVGGAAERADGLRTLINDDWRRAWLALEKTHTGFLNDVARARNATSDAGQREAASGRPVAALGDDILYGLCDASVNSLAEGVAPELLAALVEAGMWSAPLAMAYTTRKPDEGERARALAALAPHLVLLGRHATGTTLQEAIEAAQAIEDDIYGGLDRTRALTGIAESLSEPLRTTVVEQALAAARHIHNHQFRAETLATLIPLVPEQSRHGLAQEALKAARAIDNKIGKENGQVYALGHLVPHLPSDLLADALQFAEDIRDSQLRARALTSVATRLTGDKKKEVLQHALNESWVIGDAWQRVETLAEICVHLAESGGAEHALHTAKSFPSGAAKVLALAGTAPFLPPPERDEIFMQAVDTAQVIDTEPTRTETLARLIPEVPESMRLRVLGLTLDAVRELAPRFNPASLVDALLTALPYVPDGRLDEVEAIAELISEYDEHKPRLLAALSQRFPAPRRDELMTKALAFTDRDFMPAVKVDVYVALMEYVEEPLRRAFAEHALGIIERDLDGSGSLQARQLAALGAALPSELQPEALALAMDFDNGGSYLEALSGLAPRLTPPLLEKALRDASETAPPSLKRMKLSFLIPYLPPEAREQALRDALELTTDEAAAQAPDSLKTLAASLPGHLKWVALPALVASWQGNFTLSDAFERRKSLRRVVSHLRTESGPHLFHFVHEFLVILARRSRDELLSDLQELSPLVGAIGGTVALQRSIASIENACKWWP